MLGCVNMNFQEYVAKELPHEWRCNKQQSNTNMQFCLSNWDLCNNDNPEMWDVNE